VVFDETRMMSTRGASALQELSASGSSVRSRACLTAVLAAIAFIVPAMPAIARADGDSRRLTGSSGVAGLRFSNSELKDSFGLTMIYRLRGNTADLEIPAVFGTTLREKGFVAAVGFQGTAALPIRCPRDQSVCAGFLLHSRLFGAYASPGASSRIHWVDIVGPQLLVLPKEDRQCVIGASPVGGHDLFAGHASSGLASAASDPIIGFGGAAIFRCGGDSTSFDSVFYGMSNLLASSNAKASLGATLRFRHWFTDNLGLFVGADGTWRTVSQPIEFSVREATATLGLEF
jgi:hypothetical protein